MDYFNIDLSFDKKVLDNTGAIFYAGILLEGRGVRKTVVCCIFFFLTEHFELKVLNILGVFLLSEFVVFTLLYCC